MCKVACAESLSVHMYVCVFVQVSVGVFVVFKTV